MSYENFHFSPKESFSSKVFLRAQKFSSPHTHGLGVCVELRDLKNNFEKIKS